ncbi:4-(cytidine 5'-diphospho)-2-C-methyl-D-erythritol kinase [Candidatus Woesearchaeota archaeon]|nr:4-(cytidine 5'-diphospho)-2-C-methyl-D-erythritol kinase [Candidatus Woesearchaeota archaeon]
MMLKAHAKVNLTLNILRRRNDGFHEISSIFQEVTLFDEIALEPLAEDKVILTCNIKELENEDNLCYRAAMLLKEVFQIPKGAQITLKKNIPIGAGLGGGSSDAAAVLMGLNTLWGINLPEKDLLKIAAAIGSDVPFFIVGGSCAVSGKGEIVEKISLPQMDFLIVFPGFSIPTKEAYAEFDRYCGKEKCREALEDGSSKDEVYAHQELSCPKFHNDFEPATFTKYPELKKIKEGLQMKGAVQSLLSGSGSSVFGIFDSQKNLKEAFAHFKKIYPLSFMAKSKV